MTNSLWTEKETSIIEKMYPSEPKDKILCIMDRNWRSIKQKARKLGIKRKVAYKMPKGTNHYFFDSWSNDMSYVLGFICADGNIKDNNYVRIKLSPKDRNHIYKIRDLLAPKKKIMNSFCNKRLQGVELCIGSQYMCRSLNKLKVTSNKTFVLEFPDIPNQHINHFIRGYFDGDGCVNCFHPPDYSDNINRWTTIFSGNKIFLNKLNKILNIHINLGLKNVRKEKNINLYRLVYSTRDSIKLAKWMYKGSTIHLERKYNKFQRLLEERSCK